MIRVAAVGDVHVGLDSRGRLRRELEGVGARADLLILPGDLTQHGAAEEGAVLAAELRGVSIPIVAVLGNHDYHQGAQGSIRRTLEAIGVRVLEGEHVILKIAGARIGVAGVKGFGGGFAGACGSEFGEDEMKAFIHHTKATAERLAEALRALDTDLRIAVTHYAPIRETLAGEKLEIYPFLGSYLLGDAIDRASCDLALHGHAHLGTEKGITAGGVPVRNVARPVIHTSYAVYCFHRVGERFTERS